ncbi:hypothetical protein V8E36_002839 [Tilletia maclaganii]
MPASNGSKDAGSGGAGASTSEKVPLPFHRIVISPMGGQALLLSASRAIVLDLGDAYDGQYIRPIGELQCPTSVPLTPYSSDTVCFPRHGAFSPNSQYLALVGDDKVIHVWKLDRFLGVTGLERGNNALAQGTQVLVKALPKRANTVFWEDTCRHIVVGDRSGDIRVVHTDSAAEEAVPSVLVQLRENASVPRDQPKGITKQSGGPGAKGGADSDDEDGDDPQDPWAAPRVGHTSMLTAALLVGSSHAEASSRIATHIITADRDEHIRISRWGPNRAGWVVENYLLGSNAFIGALAVLPNRIAQAELGVAGSDPNTGLLLASDGGRKIRVWDYLQQDSSRQLIASVDVSAAILPHATVSGKVAKPKGKRGQAGKVAAQVQDETAEAAKRLMEENSKLAITKLVAFESQGKAYVLFTAEGCKAFFTLPVSAFAAGKNADASAQVQVTTFDAPVLDLDMQTGRWGTRAWITLDTTTDAARQSTSSASVRIFEMADGSWSEHQQKTLDLQRLLEQGHIDRVESNQVRKFSSTYYDALKTYPKLGGESSSNLSSSMTAAGVYQVAPEAGAAFAKRKENMDRIRAAAEALEVTDGPSTGSAPRKKVKKEPKEERVFEIIAMDEQVGGGPRKKGKGKAVTQDEGGEAEASREDETNDAEEVEVEVAEETEAVAEAASEGASKATMEERMAKLKELRKKMNDSARANRKDVIAEQVRQKNGGQARDPQKKSWKLQKAEKVLEERDLRESGEDVERARAWGYSIEDNEAWEKKLEDKEERRDKGPVDFNTAAERTYQRQLRQLKPDLKEYERTMTDASAAAGSSSSTTSQALIRTNNPSNSLAVPEGDALSYGTHKPSEAALERLASHINNEHEVKANRSRKRPVDPDSEVTYINEKNRRFNEKAERFYGKYTKEIRDSFERGTAL